MLVLLREVIRRAANPCPLHKLPQLFNPPARVSDEPYRYGLTVSDSPFDSITLDRYSMTITKAVIQALEGQDNFGALFDYNIARRARVCARKC